MADVTQFIPHPIWEVFGVSLEASNASFFFFPNSVVKPATSLCPSCCLDIVVFKNWKIQIRIIALVDFFISCGKKSNVFIINAGKNAQFVLNLNNL